MSLERQLDEEELCKRIACVAARKWQRVRVGHLQPLRGGISSLTFSAMVSGGDRERAVAIKVAPPGLAPVRNRDVLRQARLLRAIADAPDLRVPKVLFEDDQLPPFFAMEFVEGESYEPKVEMSTAPPPPEMVCQRALAAMRMLAALHSVQPASVGLDDEPRLSVSDELDRWTRLFATVPDELRRGEEELRGRLLEAVPDPVAPCILHGDYRLGNILCVGGEPAAIVDWELWSVGDPRTDLGFALTFSDPVHRYVEARDHVNTSSGEGMPALEDQLSQYLQAAGGAVTELKWFLAYASYKIAATHAVLIKQSRRGGQVNPAMDMAAKCHHALIGRAHQALDSQL